MPQGYLALSSASATVLVDASITSISMCYGNTYQQGQLKSEGIVLHILRYSEDLTLTTVTPPISPQASNNLD